MTDFSIGDLVNLKSGSPVLTVDDIRGDGVVVAVYWNGREFMRDVFLPQMLVAQATPADRQSFEPFEPFEYTERS